MYEVGTNAGGKTYLQNEDPCGKRDHRYENKCQKELEFTRIV